MFKSKPGDYKKAFVFGTGGGNDITSAVLAAMYLQRHGIQTDIGGMLSPAAMHTFNEMPEQAVNRIEKDIKRRIPSKKSVAISFFDSRLPGFVADEGIEIGNFYELSIRFGTATLTDAVNRLIEENSYDLVVGVDMGGDILARGKKDPTLLSPALDFTSLYLLRRVNADALLVEFGLGTDGELRPGGIDEIIAELCDKRLILEGSDIKKSDPEVVKFRRLFDKVKKIRAGHATAMTLQTLDTKTPKKDITTIYRFLSRIGKRKWETFFPIILPHKYFGKAFTIDSRELAKQRRRTAFAYDNPLEQYVRLKEVPNWKTELDLGYIWSGDNWTTPTEKGSCMMLLAPSKAIHTDTRQQILEEGCRRMVKGSCDLALVLKEDLRHLPQNIGLVYNAGNFCLITYRKDIAGFMKETAAEVQTYQR
ncbi:MAG: DUF1152 domain-containing protein [Nanoarchaeota archaeon]|nr:DUF1152 domain-containing protein [Nanoarchaeota archaeon]